MKNAHSLNGIHRYALSCLFTLGLLPTALAQTTYIVDDDGGPGVDFTQIQPALNVAGPGDLVEVRAGTYAAFAMESPTRLLGEAGASVNGTSQIFGISSTEWTVVAGLAVDRLQLFDCPGTILLDGIELRSASFVLDVDDCQDVRGRDLRTSSTAPSLSVLVSVRRSAVQLSDCLVEAPDANPDNPGGTAIEILDGSYLHLTDCVVRGGRGGDAQPFFGSFARDGGHGIRAEADSDTRIVRSSVRGGGGGFDNVNVFNDGRPGNGLHTCGGDHEIWSSTILGGNSPGGTYEPGAPFFQQCGGTIDLATPLPSMTQLGAASANVPLTLEARAEPSSSGRLIFGRSPVRVSVPGSSTPRLVTIGRLASLGAMPGTGVTPLQLSIPAWPRGTVVFLQTSSTIGAATQMSNGLAVIVR